MTTAISEVYSMSKRGRPRKSGEREPNGRLSRSAPDRGPEERQAHAARLVGESRPGVDLDDALAVLAYLGHITNEQAAAGTDYGRAHHALYGKPWIDCGEKSPGRSLSANSGAELEAKVKRGDAAISTAGGNAVTICRSVCIARLLPGWAQFGPVITLKKAKVKTDSGAAIRVALVGATERDRQKLRAMKRELPALKKGLDQLIKSRFGGNRAMEMAA